MNLAEYKQRNRKAVTLPSGLECQIKKLSFGEIQEANALIDSVGLGQKQTEGANVIAVDQMLCCAVVAPFKLVKKQIFDCADDELSITDLDNQDYEFLVNEVTKFSGMVQDDTKKKLEDDN